MARRLLADGASPIEAVKALRSAGLPLGDAKAVVHAELSPSEQDAVERLWDAAFAAVEDEHDGA